MTDASEWRLTSQSPSAADTPAAQVFGVSARGFGADTRRATPVMPFIRCYTVLCNTALGVVDRRHAPLAPLLVYISLCI